MGKIDINSLGISGKIGPIIAYVTKTGKQVFKKYVVPKDPRTEKQLASRMRFGLANSAASPLNKALKRSFSNQANAYRKTVSQILKNAIQGEYPDYSIDYSRIKIAEGELESLPGVTMSCDIESATASFKWDGEFNSSSHREGAVDKVNFICLNETVSKAKSFIDCALRQNGNAEINLSDIISSNRDKLHFWVYLTSTDGRNSAGYYAGSS
jgi:hypothetical protein